MIDNPVSQSPAIDKMTEQLVAWSEMLKSGALSAVDFAKEQVPGVLREMVLLGRVQHTLTVAILIAVSFFAIKIHRGAYFVPKERIGDHYTYWKDSAALQAILSGLIAFPTIVWLAIEIPELLKVWFAPRLYLLERISDLLR